MSQPIKKTKFKKPKTELSNSVRFKKNQEIVKLLLSTEDDTVDIPVRLLFWSNNLCYLYMMSSNRKVIDVSEYKIASDLYPAVKFALNSFDTMYTRQGVLYDALDMKNLLPLFPKKSGAMESFMEILYRLNLKPILTYNEKKEPIQYEYQSILFSYIMTQRKLDNRGRITETCKEVFMRFGFSKKAAIKIANEKPLKPSKPRNAS